VPLALGIAAVVVLGAAVPLWGLFAPPETFDLEITNPGERAVHVALRSSGDSAALGVGWVDPGETYRFRQVRHPGDTFIVQFDAAGVDGGGLALERDELAQADHRIEVPAAVEDRLADAGVSPSP
jgi:hypothetical protein